ncbi:sensor histidine kinase [Chondrinema litorale]|uniref:sensor histidine kinase n=1 Tax=Chondrinema litorale TaxID=2994555 RepID=UPI002542B99A|nr:histidine kinase [Chondrinema litorale]UZR97385.1 histidine kinase [Chondrinema litorale]
MPALFIRQFISPLIHILVWVFLAVMLLLFQPLFVEIELPVVFWIKQGLLFILWLGAFYFNYWFFIPRILFKGNIFWFVIAVLLLCIAVVILLFLLEVYLQVPKQVEEAIIPNFTSKRVFPPVNTLLLVFFTTFLVLGIGTCIAVVQKWQNDTHLHQQLEKDKISSELSFLKAQINPHFFFNTLNNIYILTSIDIETSRKALHKLSRMMRYVLYETQKEEVLLSQEIAFLEDYMTLMKLRLTDNVQIRFESPKAIKDVIVAPMLFLPFVENAFKHGVSAKEDSCIDIAICQQSKQLEMRVANTKFNEKRTILEESNGIGLVNTRRRLDLLYRDKYKLEVNELTTDNKFLVHLTIDLS